jgi:hypothetical protein
VKPNQARQLIRLVPTKAFADLLLSLVTLRLTERAVGTAGNVRANWSEASCCPTERTELRRLLNCLEADPSENTACNNTCCDCWLPWKFYLSDCCLDTNLLKRYLVTEVLIMWEVSMGGSHTRIYILIFTAPWLAL